MDGLLLDPLVNLILRWSFILLFGLSALHKLRDFAGFARQLADYRLLPQGLVSPAAAVVVGSELAIACGLLIPATQAAAATIAAMLLAAYALAIGVNLARGRRNIDCGCSGPALRQTLSEGLLVRNGVLIAAALFCAMPTTTRDLGPWDWFMAIAAVLTVALLYTGANTLLANGPLLKSLTPDYD
ncbi:MAG: MauE/DoxX family redox-associated membrane protein [Gammaproteobacteria bacterium]|nr:MauE/DoxX family redox-associated membrane protein [Gammaproteobacteria bacterium]